MTVVFSEEAWHYLVHLPAVLLIAALVLYLYFGVFGSFHRAWYVTISVLIGWYLSLSLVYLIPVDIASSRFDEACGDADISACTLPQPFIYLSREARLLAWRIIYWTSFLLTWAVYALMMDYARAPGLNVFEKFWYSVKVNLLQYGSIGAAGAVACAYVMVEQKTSEQAMEGILIALSNAWGLLLLVLLLGHGLVEVPRSLWHAAPLSNRLKLAYFQTAALRKNQDDNFAQLSAAFERLMRYHTQLPSSHPLYAYVLQSIRSANIMVSAYDRRLIARGLRAAASTAPDESTDFSARRHRRTLSTESSASSAVPGAETPFCVPRAQALAFAALIEPQSPSKHSVSPGSGPSPASPMLASEASLLSEPKQPGAAAPPASVPVAWWRSILMRVLPTWLASKLEPDGDHTLPSYGDIVHVEWEITTQSKFLCRNRCLLEQKIKDALHLEDALTAVQTRSFQINDALSPTISPADSSGPHQSSPWSAAPSAGGCVYALRRCYRCWIFLWEVWLSAVAKRALFFFFAALSIVVMFSELTFFVTSPDLSILSYMVNYTPNNTVLLLLMIFVPIVYMALCAYSSLFRLRIFTYYRLMRHNQSDSASLLFASSYLCRLTAPMCYNYLFMIHNNSTSFFRVMGTMNVVPLFGHAFNAYFPITIGAVCVFVLLNVYTRILAALRIERFKYQSSYTHPQIDYGKSLVNQVRTFIDSVTFSIASPVSPSSFPDLLLRCSSDSSSSDSSSGPPAAGLRQRSSINSASDSAHGTLYGTLSHHQRAVAGATVSAPHGLPSASLTGSGLLSSAVATVTLSRPNHP